jgi:hypothetical protein
MNRIRMKVLALCGCLAFGPAAHAGTPLDYTTPPISKQGIEPPSKAVDLIAGLIPWLNPDLDLRRKITAAAQKQDKDITSLLSTTGQLGVAVEVDIQHASMTTADGKLIESDRLLNNDIKVLGAGTSLEDLWFAVVATDESRMAEDRIDTGRSFFLWFAMDGKTLVSQCLSQGALRSKIARQLGDSELAKIQGRAFDGGLAAAVAFLEKANQDKDVQRQIKAWKDAQAESDKRIARINQDLKDERERLRKEQDISDQFSMMADALTFAAQAATMKAQLGADAPKALDDAKTSGDLLIVIQKMMVESNEKSQRLEVDITTIQGGQKAAKQQIIQVMKNSRAHYPVDRIPQLRLP